MTKKLLPGFLFVTLCFATFFSCRKVSKDTTDLTRNYFPLKFGKYVTYNVDSIYYIGASGTQYEIKSQMKYAVTDTFTDSRKKLNYILNVYTRPYDGAYWQANSEIILQPTSTGLLWTQDQAQFIKLMFPIQNGFSWFGNKYIDSNDAQFSFYKDWNYTYSQMGQPYFDGYVNFGNTVTVNEADQYNNYLYVDSQVAAFRIYSKEVYALNVGLVYKEFTHWTHPADTTQLKNGFTVIMQAIDYN